MGRPRRNIQAAADETSTPPASLTATQSIAKVVKASGNNLYACSLSDGKEILVELPSRFRNTIWIKRGGYVLVKAKEADARENKIDGEILNVVRGEKNWRKQSYWPKEFIKISSYEESDDEESTVGKMPPSDNSESE